MKLCLAAFALFIASPSVADVRVQFVEGAPKDAFIITNQGTCNIGPAELVIDFAATNAGLIFDVSATGAGVEVFQPFEITEGADLLTSQPTITDGDQTATLSIATLGPDQKIAFTIDVDDTNGTREITVSDDEINGAQISLNASGKQTTAVLAANAEAMLTVGGCES